jgi:hypothetical protein
MCINGSGHPEGLDAHADEHDRTQPVLELGTTEVAQMVPERAAKASHAAPAATIWIANVARHISEFNRVLGEPNVKFLCATSRTRLPYRATKSSVAEQPVCRRLLRWGLDLLGTP